jgi:hypothetical protein
LHRKDAKSAKAGHVTNPPAPLNVLTGQRPCQISGGVMAASAGTGALSNIRNNIVIRGVVIGPLTMPVQGVTPAVLTANGGGVALDYCLLVGPLGPFQQYAPQGPAPLSVGIVVAGMGSGSTLQNSAVVNFACGALVGNASLELSGDNWIAESGACGVLAMANSQVVVQSWAMNSGLPTMRTTTIVTTSPRNAYKAVYASASKIMIPDFTAFGLPYRGQIMIVKHDLHGNDEYYGVVLESQSLLLGAKLVSFTDPALATTQPAFDTVPPSQQITLAPGEGCVRSDK